MSAMTLASIQPMSRHDEYMEDIDNKRFEYEQVASFAKAGLPLFSTALFISVIFAGLGALFVATAPISFSALAIAGIALISVGALYVIAKLTSVIVREVLVIRECNQEIEANSHHPVFLRYESIEQEMGQNIYKEIPYTLSIRAYLEGDLKEAFDHRNKKGLKLYLMALTHYCMSNQRISGIKDSFDERVSKVKQVLSVSFEAQFDSDIFATFCAEFDQWSMFSPVADRAIKVALMDIANENGWDLPSSFHSELIAHEVSGDIVTQYKRVAVERIT